MQVLETSGVADAGALAHMLSQHGFRLDCVVAVVDAEAGLTALEQEIAVLQVWQPMCWYGWHSTRSVTQFMT